VSFRHRQLAVAIAAVLAAAPCAARAQAPHMVNVQLLHGSRFHDAAAGNATRDGRLSTVTLEALATWAYGDSYFFVDLASGDFADGPVGRHRMYGEWAPRLSASKVLGRQVGAGPVKDLLLAGGIDRGGDGFAATLIGVGIDLAVPGVPVAQVNVYRRKDSFNRATQQVTGVWLAPFRTGALAWTATGFVDVAGTDAGTDVMSQPQLLLDPASLFGRSSRLQAGVEWYLHRTSARTTSVPQALLTWSW
jgi:nucleoside-specific outer membrane channel protein Tsx